MRDYAKVEPKMWHGQTMKALRKCPEGVIVGLYLMTSPQSNMLGLFSQPVLYMAHETGLGIEGATKGLQHCIDVGFCSFDEESEFVWVHEMARYQIASELKPSDLRCKGIQKDYDALPDNPFLGAFFDRYGSSFHLVTRRGCEGSTQAPSKPLRSQEQEQEQDNPLTGVQGGKPPKPPQGSVELPDWMPAEPWTEFVEMRRKKGSRAPFTVAAAKGIVAELAKLRDVGQDPAQVLRQSVVNGWSGVFPLRGGQSPAVHVEPPSQGTFV